MIKPIVEFRARLSTHEQGALEISRIVILAIRGFALSVVIPAASSPVQPASSGPPSQLTIISRLSCRRAGTRFNARGIDDEGNVANFVETETIFCVPSGLCFSYVQVRGSVPIFWEQSPGLIPGQQKIQIARSPEATQPAFDKHFEELERNYGAIHILNLLSETKPGEADLTSRYRYHVRHSSLNNGTVDTASPETRLLKETEFDFHAQTRGPTGYDGADAIRSYIKESTESFAYYLFDALGYSQPSALKQSQHRFKSAVNSRQDGVFRTNCLDCLDRTNVVQTLISRIELEAFFNRYDESAGYEFWIKHSSLWADNGDVCISSTSQHYGTIAHKGG